MNTQTARFSLLKEPTRENIIVSRKEVTTRATVYSKCVFKACNILHQQRGSRAIHEDHRNWVCTKVLKSRMDLI